MKFNLPHPINFTDNLNFRKKLQKLGEKMKFHCLIIFIAWLVFTIYMYSNVKYYENTCSCLRVIQQDKNKKLKNSNCWLRTSLSYYIIFHFFLSYGM